MLLEIPYGYFCFLLQVLGIEESNLDLDTIQDQMVKCNG